MAEAEEQKRSSWWETPLLIVIFILLRDILEVWLIKWIAGGVAFMVAMLILYRFIPNLRLNFIKWFLLSVLIASYFVVAFYGIPYLLCRRIGAIWTWGLVMAAFFLSIRWISILIHGKVKDSLMKWIAVSAGFGLAASFFAYINPKGFCK